MAQETGVAQRGGYGECLAMDAKALAQHSLHGILALHALLGGSAEEVALGLICHHIGNGV